MCCETHVLYQVDTHIHARTHTERNNSNNNRNTSKKKLPQFPVDPQGIDKIRRISWPGCNTNDAVLNRSLLPFETTRAVLSVYIPIIPIGILICWASTRRIHQTLLIALWAVASLPLQLVLIPPTKAVPNTSEAHCLIVTATTPLFWEQFFYALLLLFITMTRYLIWITREEGHVLTGGLSYFYSGAGYHHGGNKWQKQLPCQSQEAEWKEQQGPRQYWGPRDTAQWPTSAGVAPFPIASTSSPASTTSEGSNIQQ